MTKARDDIGRIILTVLVPLLAAIALGVMCSPRDGFVQECHAAGGRVFRRGFGNPRMCIGPVGFIPTEDAYAP